MINEITKRVLSTATLLATTGVLSLAMAAEGGGSHYLQGTYGDFGMALSTPAGFYVRNDVIYTGGEIGPMSRGNFIFDKYKQDVWVNAFKILYSHDEEVLGGNLGFVVGLPYVLNVDVSAGINSPLAHDYEGSNSGLSDPYLFSYLNWKLDDFNYITAGVTLFSDFGSYDADTVINLGRNYWSVDPVVSYTYLNTQNGREFSVTAGVMFSEENEATNYKTGAELHIDYMLAQHFPNGMGVGLTGYFYEQLSDDKGDVIANIPLATKGFKSSGYGLGPAFLWSIKREEANPVTIIAKWVHDIESTNRLDSDTVIVSAVFKF